MKSQVHATLAVLTFSRMSAAVKDSTLEELQSGYENMDHYRVDFNAQERALSQLDFVKSKLNLCCCEHPWWSLSRPLQCGQTAATCSALSVIFFSVEQKNDDVHEEEPEQDCGEDSEDTAAKCEPLKEADEGRAQAESSMDIKKEEATDTDGTSALQVHLSNTLLWYTGHAMTAPIITPCSSIFWETLFQYIFPKMDLIPKWTKLNCRTAVTGNW